MTRKQRAVMFVGCAGLALSGCVAAVIPMAASGVIGGSRLRHHRARMVAREERSAPPPAAVPATATPPLAAVPRDRSTMKVGQVYRGDLPAPVASATPRPAPVAATAIGATAADDNGRSPTSDWSDIMRFAAAASLQRPPASALLARGSTTAMPHWLPCGDKPIAVLVNLPIADTTTFFAGAAENLRAIETMGVTLAFLSDQPPAVVARQRRTIAANRLAAPVAGTTLFTGRPDAAAALRATIGGQYCVVAVVGSRAGDFPNATLPGAAGANPGWFLIR